MQKTIFLLPVLALAVLIGAFFVLRKRDSGSAAPGSSVTGKAESASGASAEIAQLRADLEKSRKEEEAQRKRAEAAEQKLAETAAIPAAAGDAPEKKPAAKKGDWKTRRDSELEAKVKSMEWRKHAKWMIEFWKANEKARADGRAMQFSPELRDALSALQKDMGELYSFMGLEGGTSQDVFKNQVVIDAYMDSMMQELTGGTLSEAQLAQLRDTDIYQSGNDDWDFANGNILEGWKELIEHNRGYTAHAANIVSPEQLAQLGAAVTPTFMLSIYAAYSEKPISATGDQAAPAVADYWMKSFKLPDDQRTAVDAAAAEFVRRQAELAAQYGGSRSRDTEFEYLIKLIEAQMAAEKAIAQTVQVDPELAKKLLKGSGAVLRLSN